jgi:hypothetical protein
MEGHGLVVGRRVKEAALHPLGGCGVGKSGNENGNEENAMHGIRK